MSSIYDRLGTLGSPTRVRLLRLLELEELQVREIANVVQMPQSTISRHLKMLHDDGWVSRRKQGTSTWFAWADGLPEDAQALWSLVSAATDGDDAEDGLRLASVVAAREVDSAAFFGRVAGSWTAVRRELYGDGFLLPSLLALGTHDRVLVDLGCGAGDVVAALSPWSRHVIGIDREPAMIRAAELRTEALPNVSLRLGTLEDPPLKPGEVDGALLMLALHHVPEPQSVLGSVARALRPGGHVVVVDMIDHERDEYRRSMGHQHLGFSSDALDAHGAPAGLFVSSYRVLAPDPAATGPALFVAVMERA